MGESSEQSGEVKERKAILRRQPASSRSQRRVPVKKLPKRLEGLGGDRRDNTNVEPIYCETHRQNRSGCTLNARKKKKSGTLGGSRELGPEDEEMEMLVYVHRVCMGEKCSQTSGALTRSREKADSNGERGGGKGPYVRVPGR